MTSSKIKMTKFSSNILKEILRKKKNKEQILFLIKMQFLSDLIFRVGCSDL